MKKRMLMMVALVAMVCATSSAQHYGYRYGSSPVRSHYRNMSRAPRLNSPYHYVGFRVGAAFSDIVSDWDRYDDTSVKTGLNLGLAVGAPISPYIPLCLESGLYYTEKGGKLDCTEKGGKFDSNTKVNLNYLELPLVLKYIHITDGGFGIQPYAGGYLALGVGGKVKTKTYTGGNGSNSYGVVSRSAFGDNGDFQRFDGGLKIGCGFSYDILYADVSYEHGLTNISDDSFSSTHNSALMLNVGVNF